MHLTTFLIENAELTNFNNSFIAILWIFWLRLSSLHTVVVGFKLEDICLKSRKKCFPIPNMKQFQFHIIARLGRSYVSLSGLIFSLLRKTQS